MRLFHTYLYIYIKVLEFSSAGFVFLFFSLEPRLLHALCAGEEVPDDKGESKIQELSEQVHLWLQVRSEPAEHQNAAE